LITPLVLANIQVVQAPVAGAVPEAVPLHQLAADQIPGTTTELAVVRHLPRLLPDQLGLQALQQEVVRPDIIG